MDQESSRSMQRIIVEISDDKLHWLAWFDGFEHNAHPGRTAREALERLLAVNSNLGLKITGLVEDARASRDGHIECVPHKCADCGGSGQYVGFTVVEPCRTCDGTGRNDSTLGRIDIVKSGVADRYMLRMMLQRCGDFFIRDFEYPGEYLHQLATDPDCVVLGMMLSEMDGLQLMSELRERGVQSPIVFTTTSIEYEHEAIARGAFAFLDLNHFEEEEFVQILQRALATRRPQTGHSVS